MARLTLRAVEQPDGRYRISITPAAPDVDVDRAYSGEEVRELADRIHAEVRWVAPQDVAPAEPGWFQEDKPAAAQEPAPGSWGGESPAPDTSAPSDDPWGGTLSAGNED